MAEANHLQWEATLTTMTETRHPSTLVETEAARIRDRFNRYTDGGMNEKEAADDLRDLSLDLISAHGPAMARAIMRRALQNIGAISEVAVTSLLGKLFPFGRLLSESPNFTTGMAGELLGRVLERGSDGNHIVSDEEARLLGSAAAAIDAIQSAKISETSEIIARTVRFTREHDGEAAAKRMIVILRNELHKKQRTFIGTMPDAEANLIRQGAAELESWMTSLAEGLRLQRPDGSQFHNIKQACRARQILPLFIDEPMPDALRNAFDGVAHAFVVEHNWSAAFKGAGEFDDGEVGLPYPVCAFEFRLNERRVCIVLKEADEGTVAILLIGTKAGWVLPSTYSYSSGKMTSDYVTELTALSQQGGLQARFLDAIQPVADLIGKNVRAISITLEAEVTETKIVRADYKLNRAREKRGKLPLFDYHVISLAHRGAPPPLPRSELDPDRVYTHKRAHYRRGHYRHFEKHKTWIKWMLVGDPDLGFVEKHYRL